MLPEVYFISLDCVKIAFTMQQKTHSNKRKKSKEQEYQQK